MKDSIREQQLCTCLECRKMHALLPNIPLFLTLTNKKKTIHNQSFYWDHISVILDSEDPEIIKKQIRKINAIQEEHAFTDIMLLVQKINENTHNLEKLAKLKVELKAHFIDSLEMREIEKTCKILEINPELSIWKQCEKIIESYEANVTNKTSLFYEDQASICLVCFTRFMVNLSRLFEKDDNDDYDKTNYFKVITEKMISLCGLTDFNPNSKTKYKKLFDQYCALDSKNFFDPSIIDCKSKFFQDFINKNDLKSMSNNNNFWERVNKLPDIDKDFIKSYLQKAPKKFGKTLKLLMQEQEVTLTDLVTYIYEEEERASQEKSLPKIIKNDKITNKVIEKWSFLWKALLVSENTLITGKGIRYGNWKELYTEEVQNTISAKYKVNKKPDIKKQYLSIIHNICQKENTEFIKFIKEDLAFEEEEIDIFKGREWLYWEYLLNPTEAEIVLALLEEKSNKEKLS